MREFLAEKQVADEQLAVVTPPADEEVYRPLKSGHPTLQKYSADVAFMKHAGAGHFSSCLASLEDGAILNPRDDVHRFVRDIVVKIHDMVLADRSRQWFDSDFWETAKSLIDPEVPPAWVERLRVVLIRYKIVVFAASYRQLFLERLAESGVRLRLYGSGWKRHPQLREFAAGNLTPGEELSAAYSAAKINLHVHNEMSMHQRLVEGALAGGFFLANHLDPKRDHEPLGPYFEDGVEIVLFDTADDLVEKCRYYLEYEDERRAIAERMRARALENYTLERSATEVLRLARERLTNVL